MFIITTPDGQLDIDDQDIQQQNYNLMMSKLLKEKDMFQLEVDFIMLEKEFETLEDAKVWIKICFSAGANIVALWKNGRLVTAIGEPT